jgi:hypothetical protein
MKPCCVNFIFVLLRWNSSRKKQILILNAKQIIGINRPSVTSSVAVSYIPKVCTIVCRYILYFKISLKDEVSMNSTICISGER